MCVYEPERCRQENADGERCECDADHGGRVEALDDDALLGRRAAVGLVVSRLGRVGRRVYKSHKPHQTLSVPQRLLAILS